MMPEISVFFQIGAQFHNEKVYSIFIEVQFGIDQILEFKNFRFKISIFSNQYLSSHQKFESIFVRKTKPAN